MKKFNSKYYKKYSLNKFRQFIRDNLRLTPKSNALFNHIKKLPPSSTILDAGCGTGGLLELIEKENAQLKTVGIDIGQPPEFRAQGQFISADVRKIPFPDNSFDVVTCAHVIEHINDPFIVINELVRICKPGGLIYLETPSQRAALMPFGFNFWDDPTHIRPYTIKALSKLLLETGINPIKAGTKKSLPALLFGLPYMFIGYILKDEQARGVFPVYLA